VINKKAKLAETETAYRNGQAQLRALTENLLRVEGAIALLRDLIADEEKNAAVVTDAPEPPHA
jgi:hypothetical protein